MKQLVLFIVISTAFMELGGQQLPYFCDPAKCNYGGDCLLASSSMVVDSSTFDFSSNNTGLYPYQCRCDATEGDLTCSSNISEVQPFCFMDVDDVNGQVITTDYPMFITFAETYVNTDGTSCPNQTSTKVPKIASNALAWVSYWCQGVTNCRISTDWIASLSTTPEDKFATEVRVQKFNAEDFTVCAKETQQLSDPPLGSCFQLTPRLTAEDARSWCWNEGGELTTSGDRTVISNIVNTLVLSELEAWVWVLNVDGNKNLRLSDGAKLSTASVTVLDIMIPPNSTCISTDETSTSASPTTSNWSTSGESTTTTEATITPEATTTPKTTITTEASQSETDTFASLRGLCVFPAYPVPRLVDTYTAPTCSPKRLPGLESCIKEGKQGDIVTTNCSPGFSGVQQYVCTWKRIHDEKHGYFLDWTSYGPGTCTLQSCPLYNSYPFCRDACLNSTHYAEGPCPDGEIGTTTWQCWDNSTSDWSYEPSYDFSTCEVAICPAENTTLSNVGGLTLRWDESLPGVWHQNCPEPYSGTVFYRCEENGYWSEKGPDTRDCNKETHKLCPADCLTNFPGYCWNASSPGFAVQSCPSGKLGTAQWLCGSEGHWATKLPDMSNCRSNVTYFNDAIEALNADSGSPADVVGNLSQNLRNVTLVGGDINSVSNVSRLALQKQRAVLNAPTDNVKNFTVALCNLTDFLLTDTQVWWSLPLENRRQELESVLANTADSADLISLYLVNETFQMDSFPNIALRTENRVDGYFYRQSYDFAYGGVEIQLPDNFEEYDKSNVTRLASYVLSSASLILSGDQNKNYYLELPVALLSTPVLGIAIGGQPTVFQNGTFVSLRFPRINSFSEYIAVPICVFLNWSAENWSGDGCRLGDRSDHDNFFCECDHLTNFAILMNITGLLIEKVWLDCVTTIGCSVSVVSLLLSICIYYSLKARNMRYQINLNIFTNLLVAEILFLSGNSEIGNAPFCAFVAAAMQYFFLAMFMWMSLGTFHLYEQITRVFDHSRKMLFFYMFGYGVPLAIVTLALAINQAKDYGTESFCWLDTTASSGIIWSFAGPVAVTILWNVFVILLTVHRVLNARNLGAQKNPPSNGTWVIGSLSLSVLFGVTWIFGFFYVNESTIFMAYIFTIVNSFQGLFVFLFECVINPHVRNEWRPIFISFKERLTTPFRENLFDSSNWRSQNQKSFVDAFDNVVKLNKFKRLTSFQTVRRLRLRLRNMHIYFKWNSPRQLTETVSSESNTSS